MKTFINSLLLIFAPLASVPTGWAIYAGVMKIPAFPMWQPAAIVGAVAIIATSIAAGLLVVDILAYNQGMKNKTEREELSMSVWPAWGVLILCVLAEVTLSLLIVVIQGALVFGVLVFPMMTAAGVFAFAIRFDLQTRTASREAGRIADTANKERARAERKAEREQKKLAKAKAEPATSQPQPALAEVKPAFVCSCGKSFATQPALNAHKRAHKQIAGYAVSFEPITQDKAK